MSRALRVYLEVAITTTDSEGGNHTQHFKGRGSYAALQALKDADEALTAIFNNNRDAEFLDASEEREESDDPQNHR